MDFRLVEMASKQTDVLFNLLSLKMKYLIHDQTCESWYVFYEHHFFLFLNNLLTVFKFNFVMLHYPFQQTDRSRMVFH